MMVNSRNFVDFFISDFLSWLTIFSFCRAKICLPFRRFEDLFYDIELWTALENFTSRVFKNYSWKKIKLSWDISFIWIERHSNICADQNFTLPLLLLQVCANASQMSRPYLGKLTNARNVAFVKFAKHKKIVWIIFFEGTKILQKFAENTSNKLDQNVVEKNFSDALTHSKMKPMISSFDCCCQNCARTSIRGDTMI